MENSKSLAGLALLAVVGWGCFVLKSRQTPETVTKTVYVDKVVVKEVVKESSQNRTITTTKPDGTKIVEVSESKESTVAKTDTRLKSTVSETFTPPTKYSLGVSVLLRDPFRPDKREYQIELGRRLWNTPVWATTAITTDKAFLLGLKVEW